MSENKIIDITNQTKPTYYEKRYPILKAYQVFLACPDCDADMQVKTPSFSTEEGKVIFHYVCPNCGKELSTDQQYPHQKVLFDIPNVVREEVKL